MKKTPVILAENEELAPTPGPNTSLPPINMFMVRSFWLQAAALMIFVLKIFGVNLPVADYEIADAAMIVAPVVLWVWAWLERRAPNYRLVPPEWFRDLWARYVTG